MHHGNDPLTTVSVSEPPQPSGHLLHGARTLFASLGDVVSFVGLAFVAIAMLHLPAWIALLGLAAAVLVLLSTIASAALKHPEPSQGARLLGFNLFMLWIVSTGVMMSRY